MDNFTLKDFISLSKELNNKKEQIKSKEQNKKEELKARKKYIMETYIYLFRNLLNYSLVHNEFPEVVKNLPNILNSVPSVSKPKKINNIRDYVYRLRSVSLIQKINILAFQIGKYNFSLVVELLDDASILNEKTSEELALEVFNKYNGSDLDYKALLTLYDIADADMNGKIVFEKVEVKEVKVETVEPKKEKRKKIFGLF